MDTLVFDVLGTMVDEPSGIRTALRAGAPAASDATIARALRAWQDHVAGAQREMADGARRYEPTDVVDREAAEAAAEVLGLAGPSAGAGIAAAARRPEPWADAAEALSRLSARYRVVALSNSSRRALLDLSAAAGLRWHLALSSEAVGAYKPARARRSTAAATSWSTGRPCTDPGTACTARPASLAPR